jgi:predicted nucleic acid-binding protein
LTAKLSITRREGHALFLAEFDMNLDDAAIAHIVWKDRLLSISSSGRKGWTRRNCREMTGVPRDDARAEIRDLLKWKPVLVDEVVIERGWKIQDRYKLSFWDALIVAAARQSWCGYLLTEDLQAGQEIDGCSS